MSSYAAEIESAARDIAEAGAPVTFTRGTGAYNDSTGTFASGTTTASADAIQVRGSPSRLAGLNRVLKDPITLLIAAAGLGDFVPESDDKMTFAGVTRTVVDTDPLAPNGVAITFRVTGTK